MIFDASEERALCLGTLHCVCGMIFLHGLAVANVAWQADEAMKSHK